MTANLKMTDAMARAGYALEDASVIAFTGNPGLDGQRPHLVIQTWAGRDVAAVAHRIGGTWTTTQTEHAGDVHVTMNAVLAWATIKVVAVVSATEAAALTEAP